LGFFIVLRILLLSYFSSPDSFLKFFTVLRIILLSYFSSYSLWRYFYLIIRSISSNFIPSYMSNIGRSLSARTLLCRTNTKLILLARNACNTNFTFIYEMNLLVDYVGAICAISDTSTIIATGCGIAGMSLLVTIVSTPIVIVFEGVALSVGGIGLVASLVNKKLLKKLEKHEKIMILAYIICIHNLYNGS
jgi:hypothetical protein